MACQPYMGFHNNFGSQLTLQWTVLKRNMFYKSKEPFYTLKNLWCEGKVPWMLMVLYETTDANKKLYL